MNKNFKAYAMIWTILLAIVNLAIFLARPIIPGYIIIYDARFWTAWGLILISFIINLVSAYIAFKDENLKKLFYNISLIRISYTGTILMCIAGAVLMLIPDCPTWIAGIVCAVIATGNAVSIVKAQWAVKTVSDVDEKIAVKSFFVKNLTVEAENLAAKAGRPEDKAACRKVYEAVRYSDPMSCAALAEIEGRISIAFNMFSEAVNVAGAEKIEALAGELVGLIGDRNRKCKMMK